MPTYNILGKQVQVDPGVSRAGAVDMMVNRGLISPEAGAQAVGPLPPTIETGGQVGEFLIGAGRSFAERSFGLIPSDVEAPDTPAAGLGAAAPLVAASFLAPGTIAGQAAVGFGLEASREGATPLSIALSAGGAGAGAGLGTLTQRVTSGIGRISANLLRDRPVTTTVETFFGRQFARTLKGGGAFGAIDEATQELMNRTARKAILLPVNKSGSNKILRAKGEFGLAEDNIGALYKKFYAGVDDKIDMNAAAEIIDAIPAGVLPRKAKLMAGLRGNNKAGFADADTLLRDLSPQLKGSQASQFAPELDRARKIINESAGGDQALLREANKRWNMVKSLQEIDQVVKVGDVPAGQLVTKMRRPNRKGLAGFVRGTRSQVDDVDDLADVASVIAGDPVPIGSETFSRAATFGPGMIALGGMATGTFTPTEAVQIAGLPLLGQAFGPAAFGRSIQALSQASGAAGGQAARQFGANLLSQ